MRILTRYILGEILSHTLIGCALFTFILLMKELPKILDTVVRNSNTFSSVFEVVLFLMPNFLMVTIPMAVLVGVLLGLSRLAADSEIVAMRASGLGIGYFVRVSAIVAIGGTAIGLFNSLYVAPRANQRILDLDKALASQATYEIQPRVFYEDFKNTVLYVQDVRSGTGAANWRQVFMADITDQTLPKITTAASATVMTDTTQELLMRLHNGTEDDPVAGQPEQSNISTFAINDLPFASIQQNEGHLGRLDTAIWALPMRELIEQTHGPDGKRFQIELQKRFAYPAACLVLMLVAVPLGVTSRRGGKSSAWVFTILLVILYYSMSLIGIALGRQNWIPALLAVWSANILFIAGGLILLWQMAGGTQPFSALAGLGPRAPKAEPVPEPLSVDLPRPITEPNTDPRSVLRPSTPASAAIWIRRRLPARLRVRPHRAVSNGVFPRLLDQYVVLEFLKMFALVFDGLCSAHAGLHRFRSAQRHPAQSRTLHHRGRLPDQPYAQHALSDRTARCSHCRAGHLRRAQPQQRNHCHEGHRHQPVPPHPAYHLHLRYLAVSLFVFDEYYLPQANKRQDALRNVIKGKPAQTVNHPEQNWIFGDPRPGEPGRIFYYRFFDPDRNEFANISVFEFDPATFALTRRIFAAKAEWDPETSAWHFQNGWQSDIHGDHATGFRQFLSTSFAEIHEDPGYFNKETLQAQEMNFSQLGRYIGDLRQSGFDTMKLRVALWQKLSYPLVAVVMAILAFPFSLSMGRRGSLTGIAVAIGVALTYFVVESLFGALGNVNYLPAALAAWSSDMLFGLAGGYLLLRTPT